MTWPVHPLWPTSKRPDRHLSTVGRSHPSSLGLVGRVRRNDPLSTTRLCDGLTASMVVHKARAKRRRRAVGGVADFATHPDAPLHLSDCTWAVRSMDRHMDA